MIFHHAAVSLQQTVRSFPFHSRFIVLLAVCFAASATVSNAQTSSRPVARLISSSREVLPERPRRVTISPIAESARASSSKMRAPASSSSMSLERRAFDLINAERRARREEPLVWDEELCRMARQHSENMARQDFFNHAGPDGRDVAGRARARGIRGWSALAENIAYNQGFDDPAAFAVERWMNSTKHRNNILSGLFTRSGLGIARAADGRIFFTQVFIAR